jgi:hypothetical protein
MKRSQTSPPGLKMFEVAGVSDGFELELARSKVTI